MEKEPMAMQSRKIFRPRFTLYNWSGYDKPLSIKNLMSSWEDEYEMMEQKGFWKTFIWWLKTTSIKFEAYKYE